MNSFRGFDVSLGLEWAGRTHKQLGNDLALDNSALVGLESIRTVTRCLEVRNK